MNKQSIQLLLFLLVFPRALFVFATMRVPWRGGDAPEPVASVTPAVADCARTGSTCGGIFIADDPSSGFMPFLQATSTLNP